MHKGYLSCPLLIYSSEDNYFLRTDKRACQDLSRCVLLQHSVCVRTTYHTYILGFHRSCRDVQYLDLVRYTVKDKIFVPLGSPKQGTQRKVRVEMVLGYATLKFSYSWVRQNWKPRENFIQKVFRNSTLWVRQSWEPWEYVLRRLFTELYCEIEKNKNIA